MNDKKVRKAAQRLVDRLVTDKHDPVFGRRYEQVVAPLKQALSEPPDVVAVLRKVNDTWDSTPMKTERDWGMRAVFHDMYWWIINEFHVRLTADGWEWVD